MKRFLYSTYTIAREEIRRAWYDWRFIISILIFGTFAYISFTMNDLIRALIVLLMSGQLSLDPSSIKVPTAEYIDFAYYMLFFFLIPLVSLLITHNAISRELETNTSRYIFSKISRKAFILGKYIALSAFSALLIFLLYLTYLSYHILNNNQVNIGHLLLIYLFCAIYASAWVAIFLLSSSVIGKSIRSLFFSSFLILVLFIVSYMVPYSSPFFFFVGDLNPLSLLTSSAYLIPFTLIPLSITFWYIEVRDQ